MSNYDTYLEELENGDDVSSEALEAASDSLAFVTSLHDMFKENGVDVPEEPNVSVLENIIDGVLGELAAASIFLSENSFQQVPNILRNVEKAFTQESGKEVPTVITKGFSRFADRIEATRIQQQQLKDLIETQNIK